MKKPFQLLLDIHCVFFNTIMKDTHSTLLSEYKNKTQYDFIYSLVIQPDITKK